MPDIKMDTFSEHGSRAYTGNYPGMSPLQIEWITVTKMIPLAAYELQPKPTLRSTLKGENHDKQSRVESRRQGAARPNKAQGKDNRDRW